ncbi:MAG TPA: LamG-like jellyroll fold domain-containing protein, partial [Chthoniobacteraceae bacterium]|nr:LamG-like jellyroll fold domain-containing protein [Chthoniobacteraceae bacterium]
MFRFFRTVFTTLLLLSPHLADADCVVVFDEIMYHPAVADPATESQREWIELRSEMGVDIDLSGWRLSGGVNYLFPPGTILSRGARLLIAADPGGFQAATGVSGALGPWLGQLSNAGERIELRDNNDRVMDSLEYRTNDDWPTAADGGGASLAKREAGLATNDPRSWKASRTIGGTPGAENFPDSLPPLVTTVIPLDALWKYQADGSDQSTLWRADIFDDAAWAEACASFQLGSDILPAPANPATALPAGPTTYYFRRHFLFQGRPLATTLLLNLLADDGACVYLNGTELIRSNLPVGTLSHTTLASTPKRAAPLLQGFTIPASTLRNGDNVLAIEVHQAGALAPFRNAAIAAAPLAYWHLSEIENPVGDLADLADATESGAQTGTIQGMQRASLGVAGPRPSDGFAGFDANNAGFAFQGNNDGGDDVVLFPDDGTLTFASPRKFSVEAWVKGPAAQEDGAAIICKGTGGGGEQFCLDIVSGRFRFFVRNESGAAVVAHSTVAPSNTWQHVALAFDQAGGVMRLYVNGSLAISAAPPATLLNTNHEISLGARKGTSGPAYNLNFNGSIDEVAVYNRALSAAEILAHYNAAFAANSGGTETTDAAFAA